MSRLDDELRRAFRREQPPLDFTQRLLERVAQQPAPKTTWWHHLRVLLDPPKLRWVAIGVTALLLIAIGAAQYSRLYQSPAGDSEKVAGTAVLPEVAPNPASSPASSDVVAVQPSNVGSGVRSGISKSPRGRDLRVAQVRPRVDRRPRSEGEVAKEQLMLALSIASTALHEAQKAVRDDGLKP